MVRCAEQDPQNALARAGPGQDRKAQHLAPTPLDRDDDGVVCGPCRARTLESIEGGKRSERRHHGIEGDESAGDRFAEPRGILGRQRPCDVHVDAGPFGEAGRDRDRVRVGQNLKQRRRAVENVLYGSRRNERAAERLKPEEIASPRLQARLVELRRIAMRAPHDPGRGIVDALRRADHPFGGFDRRASEESCPEGRLVFGGFHRYPSDANDVAACSRLPRGYFISARCWGAS